MRLKHSSSEAEAASGDAKNYTQRRTGLRNKDERIHRDVRDYPRSIHLARPFPEYDILERVQVQASVGEEPACASMCVHMCVLCVLCVCVCARACPPRTVAALVCTSSWFPAGRCFAGPA